MSRLVGSLIVLILFALPPAVNAWAADDASQLVRSVLGLETPDVQEDFSAMCLDREGRVWVAYVAHDGQTDQLQVARATDGGLSRLATLAGPGVVHQPAIACDADNTIWVVWSQLDASGQWRLQARKIVDGRVADETMTIEGASGSAVFCDAGTDAKGRVWVAWQSFRQSAGDLYAKCYDPAIGKWSDEIRVTEDPEGDWEPRLGFLPGDDAAWIAFDSSRDGVFNVYLARVSVDGAVKTHQLTSSPRYEARPSIASDAEGNGFWLAWETGKLRWGMNTRGVSGTLGLNADRRITVAHFDRATGVVATAADVTPVLLRAGVARGQQPAAKAAKAAKKPAAKQAASRQVETLNLPNVIVDASGHLWLACRYYLGSHWKIALTRYDDRANSWTAPVTVEKSGYGQDRRCHWARDAQGSLYLAWPSDLRTSKRALTSGIYLASIDAGASLPQASVPAAKPQPAAEQVTYWGEFSRERGREDRHRWTAGDKTYRLYWGDFHRHTDISNCRTPHDGCIVEQFRYAYDMGKLDMLGTSDHTDIGKPYDPYEWWCNQKLADVFHAPGFFTSFYVYEREQRWPWGHRNVIFGQRGGPIIYINRGLYQSMPWNETLPVAEGNGEISPQELWQMLGKVGKPVTIISHTGATGMGTDWDGYERIDNAVENLVEIYQGARVSYEGTNTPQPQVGFPRGVNLTEDAHGSVKTGSGFGQYDKGVYQNALKNGHRLGVFANSDHISTHTSFGGVYAESSTREGLLEGLNARRTIAATDKIFMEFSCNGNLLGTELETSEPPTLKITVSGTAPLAVVTLVRNEADYQDFRPKDGTDFEVTYTDDKPARGENRYYVRVVQVDGNMGWTSPIWVQYGGAE